MCRRPRNDTHADRFGQYGSGSQTAGMDGPMIGVASAIVVDSIVEKDLSPFLRGAGPHGQGGGTIEIGRVVSEAERGAIAAL